MMKVTTLKIPDVMLFEPDIFTDERGYFFESFNQKKFNKLIGSKVNFVQDNQSKSKKGVLRGLHYQRAPYEQGKLISVIRGEIFDVVVDLRKDSKSFGKWLGLSLNDSNKKQLWIPQGFAHGFVATTNDAILSYKVTTYYNKSHEIVINFNDSELGIDWPHFNPEKISYKDSKGLSFERFRNL